MAQEIKVAMQVQVQHGAFKDMWNPGQIGITQTTIGCGGYVQTIGTEEEVIDFGDVVTNGVMILQNLDPDNYVEWGPESAGAMVTLGTIRPGEPAFVRVAPGVVVRAKAYTAAVKLLVKIYED